MSDQQNQAHLAKDLIATLTPLNDTINAVYHFNQGLPHGLLNGAFYGYVFRGNTWITALSGPNEGTAGVAPQNVVNINWEMIALGGGQGQADEAAGDNVINLGIGRGAPTGTNRGQAGQSLRPPDWKHLQMTPIRKNAYREHLATALRSPAEVASYLEANEIEVAGCDVPKPLLNVYEAGLPEDLMQCVQAVNNRSLSRLQSQCWPVVLSGRDLLAVVHSEDEGNALGYLLPAIVHIRNQEPFQRREGPIVLVLAATRESALETEQAVRDFEKYTNLRVMCFTSGVPKLPQLKLLEEGAEICVATVSRLVAFMEDSKVNLRRCSFLVVVGADRMVAMGLEGELRTIADNIRPDRQTLLWISSRSLEMDHLADELLTNHITVSIGASQGRQKQRVQHVVLVCDNDDKGDVLLELLKDILCEEGDKIIVFVDMKPTVDEMVVKMQMQGWPAVGIHKKKHEKEREWALEAFRLRGASIMVTTDVLACGLNADGVRFVVNYDRPARPEDYYRRVKHAARADGSGKVYTFVAPSDSCYAKEIISFLREAKQDVPREVLNISKKRAPSKRSRALDSYQ
ncbi:hypothetical protein V5799_017094 [Amblyomma americanum]|uniref:RNA helicase n=1 Tax=Amblyomma americanum TaxID=6943 RepID=A0AAQ4F387_AMBAM